MSQQADLATDPVYSEEGISRSIGTVDKHHKQNERNPKRGRRRRAYASVATVLNTLPTFAEVQDPARPEIRNTQRHFTITTGSQKR